MLIRIFENETALKWNHNFLYFALFTYTYSEKFYIFYNILLKDGVTTVALQREKFTGDSSINLSYLYLAAAQKSIGYKFSGKL